LPVTAATPIPQAGPEVLQKFGRGEFFCQDPRDPDESGRCSIYLLDPQGIVRQLTATDGPFDDYSATWSPDGSHIAFVSDRETALENLYVMNADGSGMRRLTDMTRVCCPAWSPDGTRIAFSSWGEHGKAEPEPAVFVVNVETGEVSPTMSGPGTWWVQWSPDGKSLFFTCGAGALCVMNADGTDRRVIVQRGAGASVLAFGLSPDGRWIAFEEADYLAGDQHGRLYKVDPSGGNLTLLKDLDTLEVPLSGPPRWLSNEELYLHRYQSDYVGCILNVETGGLVEVDWHLLARE
jgi:Tol biopolymer transport system component